MAKKRKQLSARDKETLMVCLLRNEAAFQAVRDLLKPELFEDHDLPYAFVWGVVLKFYEDHSTLPSRALLFTAIDTAIDDNPQKLTPDDVEEMEAFVDLAFDEEEDIVQECRTNGFTSWAITSAKKYLHERLATQFQDDVRGDGKVVADLPGMLAQVSQQVEAVNALSVAHGDQSLIFPKNWDKKGGLDIRTTGIAFYDDFLGGGHVPGEVYGVLGPYGSCKTTLAVMLAVEAARTGYLQRHGGDWDGVHRVAFLVSYEARKENELQMRIASYAGKIRRTSLEAMGLDGLATLSTDDSLKSYEKKLFPDLVIDGTAEGEQTRARNAETEMNGHLVVLDMTGHDDLHPGAGSGGIPEIATRVASELRNLEKKYGCECVAEVVVIDYAGAMCKRLIAATGGDDKALRHRLTETPLMLGNLIGSRFNVPVHVMHQLSAQANSRGPGAAINLDHTDSAEAKSFGENLNFATIFGKTDDEGYAISHCTKHRRTGATEHRIVRVDGNMGSVRDTEGKMVLDMQKNQIVPKSFVQSVNAEQAAAAKKVSQQDDLSEVDDYVPDEDFAEV